MGRQETHRLGLASVLLTAVVLAPTAARTGGNAGDAPATSARRFEEIRRFEVPEARQGVAVDAVHFYAVTNRGIGKYRKDSGEKVDAWSGSESGPIIHLNSGIVLDGRLYAAHSNYPSVPMWSSIEVWNAETLEHLDSVPLGIGEGSATWIDRRDGLWYVAFAHYEGRGGVPGKGPAWTRVVVYDEDWRRRAGYVFPPKLIERFGTRSCSGGAFGPDGRLYATGHDGAEIYVLRLPEMGSVLELEEIVPVAAEGQGFAWDPSRPDELYTLIKGQREVVVSRMRRD